MCHKIVSSDRQNRRFNRLAHSASGLTIAHRYINNRKAKSSWLAAVFWCGGDARKGEDVPCFVNSH